jgi:hypothetical protein
MRAVNVTITLQPRDHTRRLRGRRAGAISFMPELREKHCLVLQLNYIEHGYRYFDIIIMRFILDAVCVT